MQARKQEYTVGTRQQIDELARLGWYHSIELPDGSLIQGLQSIERLRWRLSRFPLPEDLSGKRVLDIGAWDGWFSFEMERRGAEVVAVDLTRQERFLTAKRLLGSNVEYVVSDVLSLSPQRLGRFDIVLFFGVLYHMKHPLLALERICDLSTDMALIESYVTDDGSEPEAPPAMEFYETTELRGQFDNWVGPNTSCLLAFCRTAGFARVDLTDVTDNRASVICHRRWPTATGSETAPYITCVENSVSRDHSFSARRDDYVTIWFESGAAGLTADTVFPSLGGFGARPVSLTNIGGEGWHASFKLPPGIDAGWHEVSLRTGDSMLSNRVRIPIDVERGQPAPASVGPEDPVIETVADGKTWQRDTISIRADGCVALWVRNIPEGTHRTEVCIRLDGADLPAVFVSAPDSGGLTQVNALLPAAMVPGDYSLTVRYGERESASRPVVLVAEPPVTAP